MASSPRRRSRAPRPRSGPPAPAPGDAARPARGRSPLRTFGPAVLAVLAAVGLGVWLGTRPPDAPEASAPPAAPPTAASPAPTSTAPVPARDLFVGTCGSCHSLDAAGATAGIGPDLDELRPDGDRVAAAIANGSLSGAMPAGLLAGDDAARVAAYVARSAGR